MFAKLAIATLAAFAVAAPTPQSDVPQVDQFSGELTYYAVGLGACGWTNNDSQMVVALNAPQYSLQECGKEVEITSETTGNKVKAVIVDLCPGCAHGDLDLSPAVYQALLNDPTNQIGRAKITWTYTGATNGTAPNSA